MENLQTLWAVLAAYLVGSLSFAVLVSRLMGLDDPRTYGSGNPGATNVLRSGNKKAAALTLLLDALKGVVPVAVAVQLQPRMGWEEGTVALIGLAAFLGHLWPVFFRFQGGKGVATAAGVLLAFNPILGAAT
ncbi:MAG: glycerol-3-phosphate acyltransferase, partial [Betaproteobacteria bacterium]|nr:glycerol-3-phosphate acyltransferase [Betaproteobacteria bacterium]